MMIEIEKQERYILNYKSYVFFKHVIDEIRKKDSKRKDVAVALGKKQYQVWNVFRVLIAYKVIKRVTYVMKNKRKEAVYRLVKND